MHAHPLWTAPHYSVWAAWQQATHKYDSHTQPTRATWARFTTIDPQLRTLPRRIRRALQRLFRRGRSQTRPHTALAGVALLLALGQGQALAATINVAANETAIAPNGQCSLIEAIVNANDDAATHADCVAGSGPDDLVLATGSLHTLTAVNNDYAGPNGLPVIASEITIQGNGATIQRDPMALNEFRILATNSSGNLTLQQTTITGGLGIGGGAYTRGGSTLTLINSVIAGNTALVGGGVFNNGTLVVTHSAITNNMAGGGPQSCFGGGVFNNGTLIVTHSAIADNRAICNGQDADGGGLSNNFNGTVILTDSTISGNVARRDRSSTSRGGGIDNSGSITLNRTTLSANQASYGGGIFSSGNSASISVMNSTISGNSAVSHGGGVYNYHSLIVTDSTITGNISAKSGGGIYTKTGTFGTSDLILARTLVAGNSSASSGREIFCGNTFFAANTFNLFGFNGSSGTTGVACQPGAMDIVPSVGLSSILNTTLADNGGPTLTHNLVAGSPALDVIPASDPACGSTDQRGASRPVDGNNDLTAACDIGAVEFGSVVPVCGNDIVEGVEECDDGNTDNSDGCSATCQIESPPPNLVHDLAVTNLLVPKTVTLTEAKPVQTKTVKVQIQNRSAHSETILDMDMLAELVSLDLTSLGACPEPTKALVPPTKFPVLLKSKQKLNVAFNVTFNCANDPAKSTAKDPGHEDFMYTATVDHAALEGDIADDHPADDSCPRTALGTDPNPDDKIKDKGCAEEVTDVVVK